MDGFRSDLKSEHLWYISPTCIYLIYLTCISPTFRVLPELNLSNLRLEIGAQLDSTESEEGSMESPRSSQSQIPANFIFVKNVGRHFTMVSSNISICITVSIGWFQLPQQLYWTDALCPSTTHLIFLAKSARYSSPHLCHLHLQINCIINHNLDLNL